MRKFLAGFVVVVLLFLGARVVHDLLHRHPSAVDAVASHPMPRLFQQAQLASYTPSLDAQASQAATLMKGWWSAHGTRPQDKAFAAWLKSQVPKPASAGSRKAEVAQLQKLARTRSATGTKAATWLQQYGEHDVWLYYENQQATHVSQKLRKARHRQLARVLRTAKKLGKAVGAQLHQPAPFVIDSALHSAKKPSGAKSQAPGCPCSYPTGADASSAAGSAFLSYLYPRQAPVYRHVADEYEYAQLYLGTRLPSDLRAGRMLGDMVAEYFLVTRADGSAQQVTAALSAAGSSPARSAGAPGSSAGANAARG